MYHVTWVRPTSGQKSVRRFITHFCQKTGNLTFLPNHGPPRKTNLIFLLSIFNCTNGERISTGSVMVWEKSEVTNFLTKLRTKLSIFFLGRGAVTTCRQPATAPQQHPKFSFSFFKQSKFLFALGFFLFEHPCGDASFGGVPPGPRPLLRTAFCPRCFDKSPRIDFCC